MPPPEVILHIAPRAPGTDDYPVTLHIPGDASVSDRLPAGELTAGLWTPDSIRLRVARRDPGADLAAAGQTLSRWLFPGALALRWATLASPRPPRLILQIDPPELLPIPWELACTGKPEAPVWLGPFGIVRTHNPGATPDPSTPWPLRFLVVVGCPADEEKDLQVDSEIARLERTFLPWGRSIDLHVLRRPAAADLEMWLEQFQPHVFHFAGHAGRHPDTDQQGLLFAHPGGTWVWDVAAIPTQLIQYGWFPRFVFLNACRTAAETAESASVQAAFLAHGVPAVLAMQADIRGSLAGIFAAALYQACAEGRCLREATRIARQALIRDGLAHQLLSPEWALPALTIAHPGSPPTPSPVFRPHTWPDSEPFRHCAEFEETRFFASLREHRRAVVQWLHPVLPTPNAAPPRTAPALVLHGAPRSGKSHLVKWCLESLAQPGLRLRYVIHRPPAAATFLDLLRQIRDGEAASLPTPHPAAHELLHAPLPTHHFRRCNHQINHTLEHGRPPELDDLPAPPAGAEPAPVPDLFLPLQARGENVISSLCAAFQDALGSVVREMPLLLVLDLLTAPDGSRTLDPKHLEIAFTRVLLPIVHNPELTGRLRILIIANSDDLAHFRLPQLVGPDVLTVRLRHDQTPDELARCADEMFHHRSPDLYTPFVPLIHHATDRNGLARLKPLRDLVDALPPWKENLWVDRMR